MSAGITARLAITTPELVTFHRRPAELPTRARAWLIDQLIVLLLRVAFGAALFGLGDVGVALWLVVMLLIDFGYFTVFEIYRAGQTPGKRAIKIRVASKSGARLRPGDLLLRNILRPVDSLPLTMALGGVVAWFDPYRRRLGDLAAGTIVIRDPQAEPPRSTFETGQRANVFLEDAAARSRILARISRDERDLLMDLAQRRDQIETLSRQALFAEAATYFRQRFGLPESDHLTDEQTVLNIALVTAAPGAR
ncbi:MAG: RDD family protein [Planctomycetota bacterium]